jgi:hypothetical protein
VFHLEYPDRLSAGRYITRQEREELGDDADADLSDGEIRPDEAGDSEAPRVPEGGRTVRLRTRPVILQRLRRSRAHQPMRRRRRQVAAAAAAAAGSICGKLGESCGFAAAGGACVCDRQRSGVAL